MKMADEPVPPTQSNSFIGYSLLQWAKLNKNDIKLLVVFLIGYNYIAGFSLTVFLASVGALVGKLILDAIDYWLSP